MMGHGHFPPPHGRGFPGPMMKGPPHGPPPMNIPPHLLPPGAGPPMPLPPHHGPPPTVGHPLPGGDLLNRPLISRFGPPNPGLVYNNKDPNQVTDLEIARTMLPDVPG